MSFPTRRAAPAPAQQTTRQGGGGRPEKAQVGRFHFAHAMLNGIIVREGPVKRFSQRGTPWTTATLLVDLYDSRQKKERERPAFVRVIAFHELADKLGEFEKHQRVHAAGRLAMNMYEDRDGNVRESYELQAHTIEREALPKLEELLRTPTEERGTPPASDTGLDGSPEPPPAGESPWTRQEARGEPGSYEDDIPF